MRQSSFYATPCLLLLFQSASTYLLFVACNSSSKQQTELTPTMIVSRLQKRPLQAIQQLKNIDDEHQRERLVLDTIEQFPNRTQLLCAVLSTEIGRERCRRLTERPLYLWQRNMPLLQEQFETTNVTCSLHPHLNTCLTAEALTLAESDWTQAKKHCLQIPHPQWKGDCVFALVESMSITVDSLPKALNTCLDSTPFAKACWLHSITTISKQSIAFPTNRVWYQQVQTQIEQTNLDSTMQQDLLEHFYAKSVMVLFEQGVRFSLNTPHFLYPHWQNIYAVEALRLCDQPIQDLSHWQQNTQQWMTTGMDCDLLSTPRGMELSSDLWMETTIPTGCHTISFVGTSHRLHCPQDELLNWKLALLEASVRLRPHNPIFIQEAIHAESTILKTRAEQLQQIDWQEQPHQR